MHSCLPLEGLEANRFLKSAKQISSGLSTYWLGKTECRGEAGEALPAQLTHKPPHSAHLHGARPTCYHTDTPNKAHSLIHIRSSFRLLPIIRFSRATLIIPPKRRPSTSTHQSTPYSERSIHPSFALQCQQSPPINIRIMLAIRHAETQQCQQCVQQMSLLLKAYMLGQAASRLEERKEFSAKHTHKPPHNAYPHEPGPTCYPTIRPTMRTIGATYSRH